MSSGKDNILEFNQYMKSDKIPHIIYADIESLIIKIDGCTNNPEDSSTKKIGEHIPCGYSMSTVWEFGYIQNKHNLYGGKAFMKKFCSSLRGNAKNIIDFEKKILLLTKEDQDAEVYYICRKWILKKLSKSTNYRKVRGHCHYTGKYRCAAHIICSLKFNVPNEIPVVFHSG